MVSPNRVFSAFLINERQQKNMIQAKGRRLPALDHRRSGVDGVAHQNFHRKAVVGGVDGLDPERLEDGFGLVPTWGFLGLGGVASSR